VAETRWRSPVRRVLVHGPSMVPALRDGDQLLAWTLPRPRPGAGAVVVVDLPGGRGLGVKRVRVVNPDGSVWLEGDNPFGSTDSRAFGPVPAPLLRGRVLLRLWPRPGRVGSRGPEGPHLP
jgi:signal peptidase I